MGYALLNHWPEGYHGSPQTSEGIFTLLEEKVNCQQHSESNPATLNSDLPMNCWNSGTNVMGVTKH